MESNTGRGPILAVPFLGVLMAALDIAMIGPALPAIRETFSLDERGVSWVFITFVLSNLMGVLVMSKLADVYGRRRIYLMNVSLFAVGGVVVGLSPSFAVLLLGRVMQGLAASGIFPVAAAVIGDAYEPEKRGRALGILGAVFGIAFIIGPPLAGILLLISWRWMYFTFVLPALLVLVFGLRFLPSTRPGKKAPFDVRGVLTLGILILALAYGLSQLDTGDLAASLASRRIWVSFLVALLLIPVFLRIERRAQDPVIRLDMFRNRQVAITSVLAVGAGLNEAAFIFFPTIAILAFGVTQSTASFMLMPMMVAVAIGSPVAGRILDYTGSRTVAIVCNSMLVGGMGAIALYPLSRPLFYVGSVLIGFGLAGIMGSVLSYILLLEARKGEKTVSQGIITLFISIGQIIGGALVGAIASSRGGEVGGYAFAFLAIAVVTGVLALLSIRLKSRTGEAEVVRGSDL